MPNLNFTVSYPDGMLRELGIISTYKHGSSLVLLGNMGK